MVEDENIKYIYSIELLKEDADKIQHKTKEKGKQERKSIGIPGVGWGENREGRGE